MQLEQGEFADVLEFEAASMIPGTRVGDHVAVTFFPATFSEPPEHRMYMLESQDAGTKRFTGRLVDYKQIAKDKITEQAYY